MTESVAELEQKLKEAKEKAKAEILATSPYKEGDCVQYVRSGTQHTPRPYRVERVYVDYKDRLSLTLANGMSKQEITVEKPEDLQQVQPIAEPTIDLYAIRTAQRRLDEVKEETSEKLRELRKDCIHKMEKTGETRDDVQRSSRWSEPQVEEQEEYQCTLCDALAWH